MAGKCESVAQRSGPSSIALLFWRDIYFFEATSGGQHVGRGAFLNDNKLSLAVNWFGRDCPSRFFSDWRCFLKSHLVDNMAVSDSARVPAKSYHGDALLVCWMVFCSGPTSRLGVGLEHLVSA